MCSMRFENKLKQEKLIISIMAKGKYVSIVI